MCYGVCEGCVTECVKGVSVCYGVCEGFVTCVLRSV